MPNHRSPRAVIAVERYLEVDFEVYNIPASNTRALSHCVEFDHVRSECTELKSFDILAYEVFCKRRRLLTVDHKLDVNSFHAEFIIQAISLVASCT